MIDFLLNVNFVVHCMSAVTVHMETSRCGGDRLLAQHCVSADNRYIDACSRVTSTLISKTERSRALLHINTINTHHQHHCALSNHQIIKSTFIHSCSVTHTQSPFTAPPTPDTSLHSTRVHSKSHLKHHYVVQTFLVDDGWW